MDAEGTLPLGQIDDACDLYCDLVRVGVVRFQLGQARADPVHQASVARLVGPRHGGVSGRPAWAKWFVPEVKAPGTTITVSMPNRASSAE